MIFWLLLIPICALGTLWADPAVTMRLGAQSADTLKKMNIAVVALHTDTELEQVVDTLCQDLEGMGQHQAGFVMNRYSAPIKMTKKWLRERYAHEELFALVCTRQEKNIAWWLYDTGELIPLISKKISTASHRPERIGHIIADTLWELLTGQEAIFSTHIAYCRETASSNGYKDLCIQYPASKDAQLLIKDKILAPRWNKDEQHPFLLYSQVTPVNVRLMSITPQGKRSIVANFDGATMLPTFSRDGKKVVYCSTSGGQSQLYAFEQKEEKSRGTIQQLTHLPGNVLSPFLCDTGDIIFCSDHEYKSPQIYYMHASNGVLERLTSGGYCVAPQVCEKTRMMVYSKLVDGTLQIFTYNLATKEHQQITFDGGDKDECCWSPGGNYISFVYRQGTTSRIAVLNRTTQERFFLTPEGQRCRYPSWSPYCF